MPKEGPAFPISEDWQERVRARMSELGISQNELGRRAKISKSSMSAALKSGAVQSTVMREIHEALGWPAPLVAPSNEVLQLAELYEQLSERAQGRELERVRQAVEEERRAKAARKGYRD